MSSPSAHDKAEVEDNVQLPQVSTTSENEDAEGSAANEQSSSPTQANSADSGPSQLEEKIIRQVEYYFGDRNMPRDKFLQQAATSNEGGFVPIATLLTFNRLKALSSNEQLIATAVRKSQSSLVQVSDDGSSIRRDPEKPLPDIFSPDLRKVIKSKTIYAKGFSEDVSLDELQSFFETFGKVENIQMKRLGADEGRKFKGSVFVEFVDKNSADKFLSEGLVKWGDRELVRESKEDYFLRKNRERKAKKELKTDDEVKVETNIEAVVRRKACVLHFKGCGENPTWDNVKEAMSEYATVAYVDIAAGSVEGYVRFKEEGGATKAMEGLMTGVSGEAKPQLLGGSTDLRVLEGEEEEEYWVKVEESKARKKSVSKGRKGWSLGQKRKRRGEGLVVAKQPKTEQ